MTKKIYNAIKNFFKMAFIYIANFFLYLFGRNTNKEKIKENKIKIQKLKQNKKKETYYETPTTLPDEDSILTFDMSSITKDKELIKKEYTKEQLKLIILIDDIINKTIEKKENIKIKDLNKKTEIKIEKLKEKIVPTIIKEISKDYIRAEYQLKKFVQDTIDEEFKENPLFENEQIKQESIITPPPITIEDNIIEETIDAPKLELKDEITNILKTSAIVMASIASEIVPTPQDIINKDEKPKQETQLHNDTHKEEITVTLQVKEQEEVKIDEPTIEDKTIIKDEKEIKKEEKIKQEEQEEQEEIKEELEEIKKETEKEKEKIEEKIEKPIISLNPIEKGTKDMVTLTELETSKEELEDKNYDTLEDEINNMLNEITNFLIKYEHKLTEEQKQQLNNELEKLRFTKKKMLEQKEQDIKTEEHNLDQYIASEEIRGLKDRLSKEQIEYQNALYQEEISRIEDLNNLPPKEASKKEKKLIKKQLRKASRNLAITSLLSLPFVRNKYFFYFSIGALTSFNFRLISSILHRNTLTELPTIPTLEKGENALYEALNGVDQNMLHLNQLETEILTKYPELSKDNEYLLYIENLKLQLSNTEDKLKKKQETLNKYCRKSLRYKKILRKKN